MPYRRPTFSNRTKRSSSLNESVSDPTPQAEARGKIVMRPICPEDSSRCVNHKSRQWKRALISRPELLLADEPTGNVDPGLGRRLLRLFMELQSLGTAVLIATHDLNLMEIYDAPRLVLADGHLHVDA